MLKNVINLLKQISGLVQSCSKLDANTKKRLLENLEKTNKLISLSSVKEDWVFVETDEIIQFFANFFDLYQRLKMDLQKFMNKNFLCSSSKGKSLKSLN